MNNISRINYKNSKKDLDFEIVELDLFYSTRPKRTLERDYRVNFWSIIYITEGQGNHWVDFKKYAYKKGDMIVVQKNQVHRHIVNLDIKGYVMMINEPFFYRVNGFNGDVFLEFVDRSFGSPILHFDVSEGRTNRTIIDLIYHEYNKSEEHINVALIATLFQSFILSLKGQLPEVKSLMLTKDYEHFKLYRELVEKHYMKTRNVEDYANMMHLSKKTINQATRNVLGLSAKQFIINRVILEIKRYLSQGELMNYQIADSLGFLEAANMTKFFKHYEGISPKEFKTQLK